MRAGQLWRGRRIAPSHEGPRNESNNNAHEPTSGRSTRYGSGHLIRVFRDIGHIFSSLYPSLAVLFLSRFAPRVGPVALRQTFALTRQTFALTRQSHWRSGLDLRGSIFELGWGRSPWARPAPRSIHCIGPVTSGVSVTFLRAGCFRIPRGGLAMGPRRSGL
jgi:hypothetical protein